MCWSIRVGAVVTCNLVTRLYGDISYVMYKLLICCWISQPVNNTENNTKDEFLDVPWFQNVNRGESEVILKQRSTNGDFIIRPSSKTDNVCSLSVYQDDDVYHINIRRRFDGFLALGRSKPNENCFSSIKEIVECYTYEKLLINSSGKKLHTLLIDLNNRD